MPAKTPIHTGPLLNSSTALILSPGAAFRENEFGTDVWDIPYDIPTQFVGARMPARYSSPTIGGVFYPNMHLVSRSFSHNEGLMSKFNLTFKGVGLSEPDDRSQDGTSLQSGQSSIEMTVPFKLSLGVTYQYYAATTTWRWISKTRPDYDTPRKSGTNSRKDPWDSLLTFVAFNSSNGFLLTNQAKISSIVSAMRSANPGREKVTDYRINEVIPGRFWECESTTTRIIGY